MPEGDVVVSPPIDVAEGGAVVISTSRAVVIGGGFGPPPESVLEQSAWRLDRASGSWRALPDLPDDFLVTFGVAIDDVPYFVGNQCPPEAVELDREDCPVVAVHRLVADGTRWETSTPPEDLFPRTTELGGGGVLGDHGLALASNSPPFADLTVLDTTDGSWTTVAPPAGADGRLIDSCFTGGLVYLRDIGPEHDVFSSTDPTQSSAVEQYRFRIWATSDGSWAGPTDVDLGPVVAVGDVGGAELCTGGRFLASNTSAGGRGVTLSVEGATVRRAEVTNPVPGRGPSGAVRAGVTSDGTVMTLDADGDLVERAAPGIDLTGEYRSASEGPGVVDLPISEAADPGPARVVSVPRR